MTRLMLNQSADEITLWKWGFRLRGASSRLSFVLLIAIWSQSASILTKAFTGLLLNNYFNQKLVPIVETLQDIYLNKQILIASDSKKFKDFSERLDESNELKIDVLRRIIEFEEKFKYSELNAGHYKEIFFRKLIKGEMVFLMGSQKVLDFMRRWNKVEEYFHVSSNKYSPNYVNYLFAKNNPMAKSMSLL